MGRKKTDVQQLIENMGSRNLSYAKRKRGLIKKAIELSTMCGQHISISIFSKERQKLIQYCSSYDFNPKLIAKMLHPDVLPQFTYQLYSNNDYKQLEKTITSKSKIVERSDDEDSADEHRPSPADVDGEQDGTNGEKRFVLKHNVENVEALNEEVDLEAYIEERNQKEYRKRNLKQIQKQKDFQVKAHPVQKIYHVENGQDDQVVIGDTVNQGDASKPHDDDLQINLKGGLYENAQESIRQLNEESVQHLQPLPVPYISFMNQIYVMHPVNSAQYLHKFTGPISNEPVERPHANAQGGLEAHHQPQPLQKQHQSEQKSDIIQTSSIKNNTQYQIYQQQTVEKQQMANAIQPDVLNPMESNFERKGIIPKLKAVQPQPIENLMRPMEPPVLDQSMGVRTNSSFNINGHLNNISFKSQAKLQQQQFRSLSLQNQGNSQANLLSGMKYPMTILPQQEGSGLFPQPNPRQPNNQLQKLQQEITKKSNASSLQQQFQMLQNQQQNSNLPRLPPVNGIQSLARMPLLPSNNINSASSLNTIPGRNFIQNRQLQQQGDQIPIFKQQLLQQQKSEGSTVYQQIQQMNQAQIASKNSVSSNNINNQNRFLQPIQFSDNGTDANNQNQQSKKD